MVTSVSDEYITLEYSTGTEQTFPIEDVVFIPDHEVSRFAQEMMKKYCRQ